jgi:regulator of sigma E protease
MNFLLAVVLMILVVGVDGIPSYHVYINQVTPNSPAAKAGWQPGDQLIEVAGAPVKNQGEIGRVGRSFAGKPMSAVILRDGKQIQTSVTPRQNPPEGERPIGVAVSEYPRSVVQVDSVIAGKPAAASGIKPGDRFRSFNGVEATDQFAFATALGHAAGATVPAVVERDNVIQQVQLTVPAVKPTDDVLAAIGISGTAHPISERVPAAQVIPRGFGETWDQMRGMLSGIRDLFTGAAPLNQLAGPIGMGQITSEIIGQSALPLWVTLAKISILLSLNLGVLNLLPLPALDGGRLLFVFLEVLRGGRRVAPEREGLVHFAGLVLLLGFMFVVAFLDVGRLLDGHSFLP